MRRATLSPSIRHSFLADALGLPKTSDTDSRTLTRHLFQPVQIGRRPRYDWKSDNFRNGIGVESLHSLLKIVKPCRLSLDDEKPLLFVADLSLPPVDRANGGHEVHAGSQPFLDQSVCNLETLLLRTAGHKDNKRFRHLYSSLRLSTRNATRGKSCFPQDGPESHQCCLDIFPVDIQMSHQPDLCLVDGMNENVFLFQEVSYFKGGFS